MLHSAPLRQLLVCVALINPSQSSRLFQRVFPVRKMSSAIESSSCDCLVICGPSGVGKGTVCNLLLTKYPMNVASSVSHTTRKPRFDEVNGVHYYFVGNEAMRHEISDKRFIEHAEVHGSLYGTSMDSVHAVVSTGRVCLLDIDVTGAKQIKKVPNITAKYIFLMPPDMGELEKRLRGRGTESNEQIEGRLKAAQDEMEYAASDDEPFDLILINDDVKEAEKVLVKNLKEWFPAMDWD